MPSGTTANAAPAAVAFQKQIRRDVELVPVSLNMAKLTMVEPVTDVNTGSDASSTPPV